MLERLKRAPPPFHITWILWSDWLVEFLQVILMQKYHIRYPKMEEGRE
jgi:hypothetical protein